MHTISMIGKTFAGDAPMFMLGVFALGATVVEVGFHKRLAVWLLGWTRGFWVPMIVLCFSMSIVSVAGFGVFNPLGEEI